MAYNKQYKDFLEISPNFESVVDIDADKRNQNLWREYIVGDDMENLVDVLCQSLGNEAPDARRSFWVHGSYGTGKSYAAIFVKHLLEEDPNVIDEFLSKSSRLSKYRNRFMKCRNKGDYLVIWKTGCTGIRTGDMMLVEAEQAVCEALVAKFGDKADLGGASLISAVTDKLDDASINWDHVIENTILSDDYSSVEELRAAVSSGKLSAIQTTAMVLRDMKFGLISNLDTFENWLTEVIDANGLAKSGIFFIWDEFTEYVAHSDDHTIMQQLSEFCKVKPFFMLYVVHRSDEMVDSMGKDRYQMITNRFHTVEFHISASAALDLIAGSIVVRNGMQNAWADERNQVVNDFKKFLPDLVGLDDKTGEMIDKLCPIHPMTIRLLSRVAESFAAAQRTMFRFMKDQSNSDIGFVGYINHYGPDDEARWLTPEWLWDYFFIRESDFSDKDTKVAPYIQHYEESLHLVESDEDALRLFKIVMLLLAVSSTTKGAYLQHTELFKDSDSERYFDSYKSYKLSNRLPQDEDIYFSNFDINSYPYRYTLLSDSITTDSVILWIDALGAEWLSLLCWTLQKDNNGQIKSVALAQSCLPTETEYNDQWNKMDTPHDKLDKLDKLAHHGVIDDPSYYACIQEQFSFFSKVVDKVEELFQKYHRVIITGDHGSSRLAARFFHAREGYPAPASSQVCSHGRFCIFNGAKIIASSNQVIAKDSDGNQYLIFKNYDHFKQSGFAAGGDDENAQYGELHGGASPEELLVPVVVFDSIHELPLTATWKKDSIKFSMKKAKPVILFNKPVQNVQASLGSVDGICTPIDTVGKEWMIVFSENKAEATKNFKYDPIIIADGKVVHVPSLEIKPALGGGDFDL